jgi:endonuclease/exonuclease/phosphatase family metal-dependent hydrolase
LISVSVTSLLSCSGQINNLDVGNIRGDIRIMFYNTENLFDTLDDMLTNDAEFLPTSDRQWNTFRYNKKILNIFKTIAAVGETEAPEIICLAEIENGRVLHDLILHTPLEKYPYTIVHYESPDKRGIDAAMLYRKDKISLIHSAPIRVAFFQDTMQRTRDILYAKLVLLKRDTVHLFVNHWPSRLGGEKRSEYRRQDAAWILKRKIDSIFTDSPDAKIIVTGDFNDQPTNESISKTLQALNLFEYQGNNALYNLSGILQNECDCGTYRYKAEWDMFDQFIVSGSLLQDDTALHTCISCVHIADFDFLLTEDKKYGGNKPLRTYQGPRYIGGFSDHLPIYLDLFY